MLVKRIEGTTRVLGKSQGYSGLPIRDNIIDNPITDAPTPTMTSAWEPTPAELAALKAGALVLVTLQGTRHPPILITVGENPSTRSA